MLVGLRVVCNEQSPLFLFKNHRRYTPHAARGAAPADRAAAARRADARSDHRRRPEGSKKSRGDEDLSCLSLVVFLVHYFQRSGGAATR